MAASRILIVANKSWEAGPLVGVLRSEHGRPASFPKAATTPPSISIPSVSGAARTVPARLVLTSAAGTAEVWCVQDLMDKGKIRRAARKKPSPPLSGRRGDQPSLVVAFGTASFPDEQSYNGCVSVGSSVLCTIPILRRPIPKAGGRIPTSAVSWTIPIHRRMTPCRRLAETTEPRSIRFLTSLEQRTATGPAEFGCFSGHKQRERNKTGQLRMGGHQARTPSRRPRQIERSLR